MLNLLHKKCKLGEYVHVQMPENANVICEGSLSCLWQALEFHQLVLKNWYKIRNTDCKSAFVSVLSITKAIDIIL